MSVQCLVASLIVLFGPRLSELSVNVPVKMATINWGASLPFLETRRSWPRRQLHAGVGAVLLGKWRKLAKSFFVGILRGIDVTCSDFDTLAIFGICPVV